LRNGDLVNVKPVFALWGYNSPGDKVLAAQQAIALQQLEDFLEL
jgi:hypothetical protein